MKRSTARLALLLGVLLTQVSCSQERRGSNCNDTDASAPVDPALLAFLSRARAAHHAADAHEAKNDLMAAMKEIEAVVNGAVPPRADAPEVREVLADSLARLAELAARRGDFSGAEKSIARGLGLVPEPSYFRGHLVEVRGLVEEQQSKALTAAGDAEGAARARERALGSFQEAMQIQNAVIERAAPPSSAR